MTAIAIWNETGGEPAFAGVAACALWHDQPDIELMLHLAGVIRREMTKTD